MSQASTPSHAARNSWLILAALAALLFIVIQFRPLESVFRRSAATHGAVGQSVPSVALESLTGGPPVNPAELKGTVVMLNFWGTWCPPCRQELPHLAALNKELAGEEFRFLAVSCSGGASDDLTDLASSTNEFLKQQGLVVPVYADPEGRLRDELRKRGAFNDGYPTTLVLDRDGVIRGIWEGYVPGVEQEMQRLIASLLVERAARQ